MISGTAAQTLVLEPSIQNLIDVVMQRTGTATGVGLFQHDDIRSHLQEQALRACQRFDPSRGIKLVTFLWPRLHGAALQLLRDQGPRMRSGQPRLMAVSLEREKEVLPSYDGDSSVALKESTRLAEEDEGLAGVAELADLALALSRLPARLRLVLYLRFYEGLSRHEAAARLCVPQSNVAALEHAGLTKLRLVLLRHGT